MAINFGNMGTTASETNTSVPVLDLSKGESLNLNKAAGSDNLKKIFLSGGWDVGESFDVDICAALCTANGRVRGAEDIIYFAHKTTNGITLGEDNRSGSDSKKDVAGSDEKDDEIMQIRLDEIDPDITQIAFYIVIYDAVNRQQTFGSIRNAFARIVDMEQKKELIRVSLSGADYMSDTAVHVANLERDGSAWKLSAVKEGFIGSIQTVMNKHA